MIVVDASVVVDFLTDPRATVRIREELRAHDDDLHAPGHLDLEVASAVRRHVAAGTLTPARADAAMADLAEALAAPLLTCDARLARSTEHGAVVRLLD